VAPHEVPASAEQAALQQAQEKGLCSSFMKNLKETEMRKYMLPTVALLAATALAVPAFPRPQTETMTKTVTFAQQLEVNGTPVQPGDYKVMVNGNDVKIERGNKLILETQGTLEQRPEKYEQTEILFDGNGNVQEIRFGGHNEALVLTPAPPQTGQQ
jgi:hypothetical protein